MGQVLHGCATTTEAVRRAIQHSQESLRTPSPGATASTRRPSPSGRSAASVADLPTGPKEPRSTVLSIEEEAIIVAFRRHTLLPLDDCLYALQPTIPHLTRSSLHRCLQRHGIANCRRSSGEQAAKTEVQDLSDRLLPYRHRRGADRRKASSICSLPSTGRRSSPLSSCTRRATTRVAADFLHALVKAVPYKIHTVLTDNGIHFTIPAAKPCRQRDQGTDRRKQPFRAHAFELACAQNDIDHRLTKPKHPWTNGQVERMNRTIKEATVKRYFYETHDELRTHLADFVDAYNFARRLKTLKGLTPYEFICKRWTFRTRKIHNRSAPANAGTKQLDRRRRPSRALQRCIRRFVPDGRSHRRSAFHKEQRAWWRPLQHVLPTGREDQDMVAVG